MYILFILISFLHFNNVGSLICYCLGHCPNLEPNGTCQASNNAKCFSAVEEVLNEQTNTLVSERTYGCMPADEGGLLQCQGHLVPHLNPLSIACCSDSDFCNHVLTPIYKSTQEDEELYSDTNENQNFFFTQSYYVALLASLTVCFVFFVLLITIVYLRYKRREDLRHDYIINAGRAEVDSYGRSSATLTLTELIEQTSSSGTGLPLLVQRTIAKQIQMKELIGKGTYGEVWLSMWRGEKVAVKVFYTLEEVSWFRETEIYQTVLMRHENLLGFVAADIKGSGGWTQMLLITDYHENGSLYQFLTKNTIDTIAMVRLAYSAACGLCHLHTEFQGTRGKPSVAHRNLKSKNIFVKRNGTCAVADFGLAVRYNSENNCIDLGAPNPRKPTLRYQAPEVLDDSLKVSEFQAYLYSDMYSFGLVLWEIARRTKTIDRMKSVVCDDYNLPFYEFIGDNDESVTADQMKQIVCIKGLRPQLSIRWLLCPVTVVLVDVMRDLWHPNPTVRLSSMRVKKTLANLEPTQQNTAF